MFRAGLSPAFLTALSCRPTDRLRTGFALPDTFQDAAYNRFGYSEAAQPKLIENRTGRSYEAGLLRGSDHGCCSADSDCERRCGAAGFTIIHQKQTIVPSIAEIHSSADATGLTFTKSRQLRLRPIPLGMPSQQPSFDCLLDSILARFAETRQ